ncbi:lipoprotein [Lentzea sp. NPDC058450]|uniref:lipoprotein n=1 Tax=Lentzea sp. NPDC058450 TaxID=3346505 RepID=UPI00364D611D
MRKTVVALGALLALSGCSSSWQAEMTFKVTEFYVHDAGGGTEQRVRLEPVGDLPEDADREHLKDASILETDLPGTVGMNDGVRCTARHESGATMISGCKKA